jgi:hypothetical protein
VHIPPTHGDVAKLADAPGLGPGGGNTLEVRSLSSLLCTLLPTKVFDVQADNTLVKQVRESEGLSTECETQKAAVRYPCTAREVAV